jgi:hypothetical protein
MDDMNHVSCFVRNADAERVRAQPVALARMSQSFQVGADVRAESMM